VFLFFSDYKSPFTFFFVPLECPRSIIK